MTAAVLPLARRGASRPRPVAAEEREAELLATLAHDLRSPLSSILVLAQALREGSAGPVCEAQRRQLDLIYKATLSLCSTATDVLVLTRRDAPLIEPAPVSFRVSELLSSVRDAAAPIAEAKGLSLLVVMPRTDCRVGHPRALAQVLLNLVTNALKFTERGFVRLAARETHGGDRLEFSVTDSGPGLGLAPRSASACAGYPIWSAGTGRGLTVCRKLVAAMGSELECERRLRAGTRFHFVLDVPPVASAA